MDPRRLPCTFPLAGWMGVPDDRKINVGDEVCVKQLSAWGETIVPGTIVEVLKMNDGGVHHYKVKIAGRDIKVSWTLIGIPRAISIGEKNPTAANVLFERNDLGLPRDVEKKIRGYGRKTLRKGRKGRKGRRTTRKR